MTSPERVYCPDPHAYGPARQSLRQDWADEMGRTHDQHPCPDCGLWVIWRPKTTVPTAEPEQLGLM